MVLRIVSVAGFLLGIVLLGIATVVRWRNPLEESTIHACDLLLAVASILTLGSASVYLLTH